MKNIFLFIVLICSMSISKISAQQYAGKYNWQQKVFTENIGQVVDQNGQLNRDVLYLYHDGLFNLELKTGGFSYEVFEIQQEANDLYESGKRNADDQPSQKNIFSHRVDVNFEGANRNIVPQTFDETSSYTNYIFAPVSTNQHLQVRGFGKIVYPNLYNGIDLVFYSPNEKEGKELSYEFIVHPGADLSKIKFNYSGATDFSLTASGDFLLHTSYGFIRETAPKYLIDGKEISANAKFLLHKNTKTFSACNYDHSQTLVIDPNMLWGTYFGGEKADEIAEVSIGTDLMPVIDGQTVSFNHIASSGAWQQGYGGGIDDWFIAKFNTDATLSWATYFGGTDKDYCYALAVDNNNNIIASGNMESNNMATAGAYQDTIDGTQSDIVIAKFSTSGNLVWSTYFGGEGSDEVRNVVTDANGDIYLGGTTGSFTNIASPGAFQDSLGGFDDALLIKFTSGGHRVWSTYYGDSGVDRIHAVGLDLYGNVYFAGTTSSTKGIATPGAHQTVYGGPSEDAMLIKFDTSGHLQWATYYGGARDDRSRGVETDNDGNVYLGGFSNSDNAIATPGSHQEAWYPGNQGGSPTEDAYLAKFSSDGVRQWGTYLGGAHVENLWGMTIDRSLNAVYIAGSSNSTENIAFGNAIQSTKAGGDDCIMAKFLTDGTLEWSTYFGGLIGDQFEDIAVDQNHFVYTVARATGNDMPTTTHVYQNSYYGGASDAMLYKFYGGNDCFDPYEPNENLYAAKTIYTYHNNITDTTIYGYNAAISSATDHDWYSFSMDVSEPNLMAIISKYSIDLNLNLYNDQGILIYQSTETGTSPDTISVNGLSAGNYFLEVSHAPGVYDSLDCYRLQLFVRNTPFPPIGIPTFISDGVSQKEFAVYPNPVHDQVAFFIPSTKNETASIIIRDLFGRVVYSGKMSVNAGGLRVVVSVEKLSGGTYSIAVQLDNNLYVGRFVKE